MTVEKVVPIRGKRARYTARSRGRGETDHISFRCDSYLIHRIDEIVAARLDPDLTTRSDVLQDAVAFWVENWEAHHEGVLDPAGRELFKLRSSRAVREQRNEHLTILEEEIEELSKERDVKGLHQVYIAAYQYKREIETTATPRHLERLDIVLKRVKELMGYGE